MTNDIHQFFRERGISEVEAIIPDMAGIARGKIMPAEKFTADEGMKLPESIFLQTVTGDYPADTGDTMSPAEIDIVLKPDAKTVREVPWAAEPTAQVIHDCFYSDGRRVSMAPRHVLRHVLELYAQTRLGTGGGAGTGVLPHRAEHRCGLPAEAADWPFGSCRTRQAELQHRSGERVRSAVRRHLCLLRAPGHRDRHADPRGWPAQMEINLLHGDPLDLADQPSCSSAPPARRHCATRCTPRSWRSRMRRSRAVPCTCTRAWWIARRAPMCSATRTARLPRCSSRTSVACRNICRQRWCCSPPM